MATALITGASSGIGKEFARIFAEKKNDLVLVARREDKLLSLADELKQKHGVAVRTVVKDLSKPDAAQELFDELQSQQILVDVLVNNAGFSSHGQVADVAIEKLNAMVQVNVTALMELSRLFAPAMVARRSGKILNVASVVSFTPAPAMATYAATKAFVLSFSEAMAEELRGTGVTVTALCPGTTESEFFEKAGMTGTAAFRSAMPARPVAEIGYDAMMAGKTVAIAGIRNKLMVFGMGLTPRDLLVKVTKKVMRSEK